MDVTLLTLHIHDPSIELGTTPSARVPGDSNPDERSGATDGHGAQAAIPVVLGVLILVTLVARRLRS